MVERERAREDAGAHHDGHEARALFVRPEDDLDGRFGLDFLVVQRANHLDAGEDAVIAIELAARGLRVDVAAARDGRKVRVLSRTAHEHVADLVDRDGEASLLRPRHDEIAPLAIEVGQREAAHATLLRSTDASELHERSPETVTIDAEVRGGSHE